ncbi:hypothetical protein ACFTQ7_20135 [Lysinibacillus sp. NPDC056959]|uniref:hypothetical protein n=1 Tax=Lysinibacillus sp. NPDC056959 TaxID=3345981 RepID=UPI00364566B7
MKAVMDQRQWHWLDYFLSLIRMKWITSNGYSIFVNTTGLMGVLKSIIIQLKMPFVPTS